MMEFIPSLALMPSPDKCQGSRHNHRNKVLFFCLKRVDLTGPLFIVIYHEID